MADINNYWAFDYAGPTSNSNVAGAVISENCPPSGLNNAIRALAGMLSQATALKSASMSASVSTNIAATAGGYILPIVGVGPINSYGLVPGQQPSAAPMRILEFISSVSVSHGTAIILLGGQSRRMQPGDISCVYHDGAGDVWREWAFGGADGALGAQSISVTTITNRSLSTSAISTVTLNAASASITAINILALNGLNSVSSSIGRFTGLFVNGHGTLAQQVSARLTTHVSSISNTIAFSDALPQITDGQAILSCTITPTNAASILDIAVRCMLGTDSTTIGSVALFRDAGANAIEAKGMQINTNTVISLGLDRQISASSTAQTVFHVRVGPSTAGMIGANGETGARRYGGASGCSIVVREILPQ